MDRMTKAQLKQALEEARRSASAAGEASAEGRFSELLADSLPGVAYLFDAGGNLLWWNRSMEEITG